MPYGPIEILVQDSNNISLAAATVTLIGNAVPQTTSINGKTTFLINTAGSNFVFTTTKTGYQDGELIVSTYTTSGIITMDAGTTTGGTVSIVITVTNVDTGAAVVGANVLVGGEIGVTNGSGQVTLTPDGLTGGTYEIVIDGNSVGYGGGGVGIDAGVGGSYGIGVEQQPSNDQTFTVTIAEGGSVLAGVTIVAYDINDRAVESKITNSSGEAVFTELSLNDIYVLDLDKSGYQSFAVQVEIQNGVTSVNEFGMYAG